MNSLRVGPLLTEISPRPIGECWDASEVELGLHTGFLPLDDLRIKHVLP